MSDEASPRPQFPPPTTAEEREAEVDASWPVIGAGVLTAAQTRGALVWAGLGGAAGLAVGVLVGLIPFASGLSAWVRVGIVAGIGLLAGATAGALYGGGREAELEQDVGNQIGPAPLLEENRDPVAARQAVEAVRERSRRG